MTTVAGRPDADMSLCFNQAIMIAAGPPLPHCIK
jgi:hypothetical protein